MKLLPIYLCALFACWLTACQSSLVTDLVARPGEELFRDEFSDSSGNWPQVADMNGSLGIANGAYRIQVFSPRYQVLAAPAYTFRDVQVEAEATWLAGPVQNLFGLACRSSSSDSYYFFVISRDGYYALGKIKNGSTTLLGQEMMAYNAAIIQGQGTYNLRLDCIGKSLKGIVNEHLIAMSEDADFSSGEVGLVAGALDTPGVDVTFDHFIVYKP